MIREALLKEVLEAQKYLYLREDDEILFVTDDEALPGILAEVFAKYRHDVVLIPKVQRPGQDYPLPDELLDGKTVGWLITSISVSSAPSTWKMMERKLFLISNPGITQDWPAIINPENRLSCNRNAQAILSAIGGDVRAKIHITDKDGTNLWLSVPKGNWEKEVGTRSAKEYFTNGTFGELVTAPFQADGIYILNPGDFLTNPINEVRETIRLEIENNHVKTITGGPQAEMLRNLLKSTGKDELAFNLGEFAFGLNPGKPDQIVRSVVAEKLVGGIHIRRR